MRSEGELAFFALLWLLLSAWFHARTDIILAADATGEIADPMLASGLILALTGILLSLGIEPSLVAALRAIRDESTVHLRYGSVADTFRVAWLRPRTRFS
jgi:hypothetical protein